MKLVNSIRLLCVVAVFRGSAIASETELTRPEPAKPEQVAPKKAESATPLVFLLADLPFSERPAGRVTPSQVKKDRYLLYVTSSGDDLVSFDVTVPRSGAYRASTRLFNQQDPGMARLIVNDYAEGPALPLAPTLQHGLVQLVAGVNVVTYQLSGTAAKSKVRLWELTFTPVQAGAAP